MQHVCVRCISEAQGALADFPFTSARIGGPQNKENMHTRILEEVHELVPGFANGHPNSGAGENWYRIICNVYNDFVDCLYIGETPMS